MDRPYRFVRPWKSYLSWPTAPKITGSAPWRFGSLVRCRDDTDATVAFRSRDSATDAYRSYFVAEGEYSSMQQQPFPCFTHYPPKDYLTQAWRVPPPRTAIYFSKLGWQQCVPLRRRGQRRSWEWGSSDILWRRKIGLNSRDLCSKSETSNKITALSSSFPARMFHQEQHYLKKGFQGEAVTWSESAEPQVQSSHGHSRLRTDGARKCHHLVQNGHPVFLTTIRTLQREVRCIVCYCLFHKHAYSTYMCEVTASLINWLAWFRENGIDGIGKSSAPFYNQWQSIYWTHFPLYLSMLDMPRLDWSGSRTWWSLWDASFFILLLCSSTIFYFSSIRLISSKICHSESDIAIG